MAKENATPVRTSDPYGDEYPKEKIRYSNEGTRDKNIKGLPKVGEVIVLPKIEIREIKPN